MSERRARQVPIAVVGVSALFPGSPDENGFWRDILAGRDLIRDVPPSHWLIEDYYDADPAAPDKTYARRGAFLDPVPFDTLGFGVPPSIVPATDTVQLLALIVAQRVLEDAARGQFAALPRERIGVILGVTSGQELLSTMASRMQRPVWVKALREAGIPESQVGAICDRIAASYVPWQESTFPGLLGNVVAGRIANRFDLGGTNCVTDAACASTFSAVSMAVNELALGQADLVITGGVDTLNDIFMYMCFSKTPALSRTGDCRPFSDEADGTMLGEGLAMVALKRLDDAEAAGDRIYAVLRGRGQLLRRSGQERLRPAGRGAGAGAAAGLRGRRLRRRRPSSSSKPTGPAPRPATWRSSRRCAPSSTRRAARTGSGARSVPSSRRSGTPRRRPGRRVSSRPSWRCSTARCRRRSRSTAPTRSSPSGRAPSASTRRPAPGSAAPITRGARRSAPSGSAAATSTSRSRSTGGAPRGR